MKTFWGLLLLASAVFSENVLDLTDANFKDNVKDQDIILVEFFAPWCGHCKRLAPEFETAATKLLTNDPPVSLAKVDCVGEGKETCSKYGVTGYPTLKIFRGGEITADYDGPRDAEGIVGYMKSRAGPASVVLKDVEHLQKKLDDAEDVLVVGFFSGDNDAKNDFEKAADQKRSDFNFAHSTDADINTHFGHEDVVVLFRPKHLHAKFENPKEVLESASVSAIKDFLSENSRGLVGQLQPAKEDSFPKPRVVVYYNIDWKKDLKGTRYWRNRVARVAKKFVNELTFAIASKDDYQRQISDWGITAHPNAAAFNAKGQVFLMQEKFSVDAFDKFVNEFKDDKLEPHIKSEAVPVDNDGPVKVVVGKNFDEIVNDPSKDVLIEFYAPWCGHCKSLEPKYVELGEKLKDATDVVIAKMDATANDVPPQYDVQGFPTIYWSPMGSKDSPKKYQGSREVDDFFEFVKKEATNPINIKTSKKKKKTTEL